MSPARTPPPRVPGSTTGPYVRRMTPATSGVLHRSGTSGCTMCRPVCCHRAPSFGALGRPTFTAPGALLSQTSSPAPRRLPPSVGTSGAQSHSIHRTSCLRLATLEPPRPGDEPRAASRPTPVAAGALTVQFDDGCYSPPRRHSGVLSTSRLACAGEVSGLTAGLNPDSTASPSGGDGWLLVRPRPGQGRQQTGDASTRSLAEVPPPARTRPTRRGHVAGTWVC